MTRHDTPMTVARALAHWAPRDLRTLLEPAVGSGSLLAPLVRRFRDQLEHVVAIDTNLDALARVNDAFAKTLPSILSVFQADFLEFDVASRLKGNARDGFDCIAMNPPFAGKKQALVPLRGILGESHPGHARYAPLEGAFLVKAVELLNPYGRILAVVPNSIAAGDSGRWIRQSLLNKGTIRCVHELPKFTFPGVEARVYLLIFERSAGPARITLCNHSLIKPDRIKLAASELGQDLRLDYDFQAANHWFTRLRAAVPSVNWTELIQLATIERGSAQSPDEIKGAVHTVDFRDGFWGFERSATLARRKQSNRLQPFDLLISRVGRRCAKSVGPIINSTGLRWTDCLFCIRLHRKRDRNRLMFALRVLLGFDEGAMLVQRGCGATYITEKSLSRLLVPINLSDVYDRDFTLYEQAIRQRSASQIVAIERRLRLKLQNAISKLTCAKVGAHEETGFA